MLLPSTQINQSTISRDLTSTEIMQGNLVLGYFLKLWGPEWARKHIHYVVAASGPWGGAVKSIKGTVSGENFGLPIPHDLLHSLQGIAPSGPWLFPSEEVWPPDDIIVRTNERHYTAADLGQMLHVCCLNVKSVLALFLSRCL